MITTAYRCYQVSQQCKYDPEQVQSDFCWATSTTSKEFIPALCKEEQWLKRISETWSCVKLLSTKVAHPTFLEQIWNHGVSSYHVTALCHFGSTIRSCSARFTIPCNHSLGPKVQAHPVTVPESLIHCMLELFREGVVNWLQANYINNKEGLVKSWRGFPYTSTKTSKIYGVYCTASVLHAVLSVCNQQQQQGLNSLEKNVSCDVLCILTLWPPGWKRWTTQLRLGTCNSPPWFHCTLACACCYIWQCADAGPVTPKEPAAVTLA